MAKVLDLWRSGVGQVPGDVWQRVDLPSLTDFLYPHDNRLSALPESRGGLSGPRYRNVGENAPTRLPESTGDWSNRGTSTSARTR
ncbi:hypothetical protein [Actinosynnema sp. NPDC023587]|uniref:hypothetical protein n=1 Tax=Actinosynnema sp. NPDC023587 TaxID=3154695 RepID=UPI0033FB94FF